MALRCRSTIAPGARRCGLGEGHIGACTPARKAGIIQPYACPTHHADPFHYGPGSCTQCPRDLVMVGV